MQLFVRMKTNSNLLTKPQTADALGGVSVSYVNYLLASGKLPKIRLSYKVVRIPRDAVERFIASRTEVSLSR